MTTTLNTLRDGLLDGIRDLYSAEGQLLKALPKMEKKATNQKLKVAIHAHLLETEGQVERLDEIGKLMDEKLTGKTCKAMQGLIEEGKEVLGAESENSALLDALLIGAAQRVEHYEMAAYGTARAMALELGEDEIAMLLKEALDEEVDANKKLTSILKEEVISQANLDSSTGNGNHATKRVPIEKSQSQKKIGNGVRTLAISACLALPYLLGSIAIAETDASRIENEVEARDYKSDNTGHNIRDRNDSRVTADDQNLGGAELEVLARIRREIMRNENLSVSAHNVKIIVENGKVILRGPVKSVQEKTWIQEATTRVASGYGVVNQLEISPS